MSVCQLSAVRSQSASLSLSVISCQSGLMSHCVAPGTVRTAVLSQLLRRLRKLYIQTQRVACSRLAPDPLASTALSGPRLTLSLSLSASVCHMLSLLPASAPLPNPERVMSHCRHREGTATLPRGTARPVRPCGHGDEASVCK